MEKKNTSENHKLILRSVMPMYLLPNKIKVMLFVYSVCRLHVTTFWAFFSVGSSNICWWGHFYFKYDLSKFNNAIFLAMNNRYVKNLLIILARFYIHKIYFFKKLPSILCYIIKYHWNTVNIPLKYRWTSLLYHKTSIKGLSHLDAWSGCHAVLLFFQ